MNECVVIAFQPILGFEYLEEENPSQKEEQFYTIEQRVVYLFLTPSFQFIRLPNIEYSSPKGYWQLKSQQRAFNCGVRTNYFFAID